MNSKIEFIEGYRSAA